MSWSRRSAFALLGLVALALVAVGVILRVDPQVIFSGVVAVSTVCYVVLTWRLVEEQRALRRAETEPQVSVYVENSPRAFIIFDLVIANIGRGPAYDVKLSMIGEDWMIQEREKLSATGPFKHGIAYLAPGQALRFFVGTGPEIYKTGRHSFSVRAVYRDAMQQQKEEDFVVSFLHFWDWTTVGEDPALRVAKSLEAVAELAKRLGHHRGRLIVELMTQEDVAREQDHWENVRNEMRSPTPGGTTEQSGPASGTAVDASVDDPLPGA